MIDPASLVKAVIDNGFTAELLSAAAADDVLPAEAQCVLGIKGMTCSSCVGRIEDGLSAHPGVLSVEVNLLLGKAGVRYAPAMTDPAELAAAVAGLGFEADIRADSGGGGGSSTISLQIEGSSCCGVTIGKDNSGEACQVCPPPLPLGHPRSPQL